MSVLLQPQVESQWLMPVDGSLRREHLVTKGPAIDDRDCNAQRRDLLRPLQRLQATLNAGKQYSVLLVFQALDAAGKDSTIRSVFKGLDPAGLKVAAFKRPTALETAHDFLWRTCLQLPQLGEIGIFNRSYYEEVLAVKVHPEFLGNQYPGRRLDLDTLWAERYSAIAAHERHLAASGTLILKFWLNVSKAEQYRRFESRLETPKKQWKFNPQDVYESEHRDAYQDAFVDLINATAKPWAPWFMIPADSKPYMRWQVADIVQQALAGLDLKYPEPEPEVAENFDGWLERLKAGN